MKVNGSGSMTCRGTDRHGAKVWTLRVKLCDGSRPSRTFHGSKTAARRELNEWIKDLEDGMRPDAGGVTFAEYADAWEANRATLQAVRPATLRRDAPIIRTLCEHIGNAPVPDIDATTVRRVYARMSADGMSADAMHKAHVKLKQIMRAAVNDGLATYNPCDRVKVPAPREHEERHALGTGEAARLAAVLDACGDTDARAVGVRLGLATGMRLGEVLGLVWGNVSLSDGFIDVVQQKTSRDGIQPPKSAAGVRRIAIDAATVAHLAAWKDAQRKCLKAIWTRADGSVDLAGWASFWKDDGAGVPVVSTSRGTFHETGNYQRWFRGFCAANGFGAWYDDDGAQVPAWQPGDGNGHDADGRPYSRTNPKPRNRLHYKGLKFHELRHTQATFLVASGMDIKTVQARLGHASITQTLDMYAHATPENDRRAADMVGGMLEAGGTPVGKVVNL